jgi:tRNA threonylcarbamoyladenosine biosynthesis protein TsaE
MLLRTTSVDETRAVGERLGALLEPGDVVLLQGELGTGKTAFTQGIGRGTGSQDLVNSPTFVLINEYRGRVRIYHVDLYRLEEPNEIAALDLQGSTADGVLVVEWPERGVGLLPADSLHVAIAYGGGDERRLTLTAFGDRAARLVDSLAADRAALAPARG